MPDIDELLTGDFLTDEEKARIRGDEPAAVEPEPEEPAEDAPEPDAEPESEPEPEEDKKTVDEKPQRPKPGLLKALDKQKAARREAEARAADLEARLAAQEARWKQAEERLNGLTAAKQAEAETPKIPEMDVDPLGHVAARLNINEQILSEAVKHIQSQQQNDVMARKWGADTADFMQRQADLNPALNFLAEKRAQELKLFGMDEESVHRIISREAHDVRQHAARTGQNAAEIMYKLAESRGYRAEQPAAVAPKTNPAADLARISEGQRKASALTNNGGGDSGVLTLESLADMPMEQYNRLVEKAGGLSKFAAGIPRQ